MPRRRGWRTTSAPARGASSALPSEDPSSTTMTGAWRRAPATTSRDGLGLVVDGNDDDEASSDRGRPHHDGRLPPAPRQPVHQAEARRHRWRDRRRARPPGDPGSLITGSSPRASGPGGRRHAQRSQPGVAAPRGARGPRAVAGAARAPPPVPIAPTRRARRPRPPTRRPTRRPALGLPPAPGPPPPPASASGPAHPERAGGKRSGGDAEDLAQQHASAARPRAVQGLEHQEGRPLASLREPATPIVSRTSTT